MGDSKGADSRVDVGELGGRGGGAAAREAA